MLKKFKSSDIDVLMEIWKRAYTDTYKAIDNAELTRKYTEIRDIIMDKSSETVLYTEDGNIEGFVVIDSNSNIVAIYVDKDIRREGIGSKLIQLCQKKYDNLKVSFTNNKVYECFFEKNNFTNSSQVGELESTYEWKNTHVEKINVVYFDNDLDDKLIDKTKFNVKAIDIKQILEDDRELKSVKNYMKVRKIIESSFAKKTILYLNYGNYHETIDDIIKEIIKIEKSKFALVVSEPLIIENPKMEGYLKKIEQSYSNYKIYRIETATELNEDISVNKILEEKMKIIIKQIDKIAENM